jgi:ribosomal protein S18 acetylase RimI-like enzyme
MNTITTHQTVLAFAEDGRQNLPLTIIETVTANGDVVGRLKLETDGTCYGIWVKPEHRRQGIATQMWQYAQTNGHNPQHSAERTADGEQWANSFNIPLPELIRV